VKSPQESLCLAPCLATDLFVPPKIPNYQELTVTEKYSTILANDLGEIIILE